MTCNAIFLKLQLQLGTFPLSGPLGELRIQVIGVALTLFCRSEARVEGQTIAAKPSTQASKVLVVGHGDRNPAIVSRDRIATVWCEGLVPVASPRGVGVVDEGVEHRGRQEVERGLRLGKVEMNALPVRRR